jgi:hypothetical protein
MRRQAMLLAAIALFLRILIPSGWMPAADGMGLMPCLGTITATAMPGGAMMAHHASALASRHDSGHNQSDKGEKPCAFVGFACALAEPDGVSGPVLALVPMPLLLAAVSTGARIGAGLAAPPPPPTGPPITA